MNIFRKNNSIKKIIISLAMVAVLLLPIVPVFQNHNNKLAVTVEKTEVKAEDVIIKDLFSSVELSVSNKKTDGKKASATISVSLTPKTEKTFSTYIKGKKSLALRWNPSSDFSMSLSGNTATMQADDFIKAGGDTTNKSTLYVQVPEIKPDTVYYVKFVVFADSNQPDISNTINFSVSSQDDKGTPQDTKNSQAGSTGQVTATETPTNGDFLECDRLWAFNAADLPCQLTKAFYYLIFTPIAWIAGFAGRLMDFFVYYSTNDSSYRSEFVSKAWGAVRDIANIFFIIALLYVAIKMILGLGGHDSKKIIIWVVLMGLLINFSLFFTQVVIDSSNILAKVFYNHIDVKTKGEDQTLTTAQNGASGEKQLSAGLVRVFEPQDALTQAGISKMTKNLSLFFLVTLMMTVICGYMIFMFVSVSFLFVGRVVGLWIVMVMAPVAFVSYALPFDIPGLGHKKWWSDLLKQAFMAPIFIFFLYVIYIFSSFISDAVKDVGIDTGQSGIATFMKIIIPMLILFGLLQQAKKLAVEYSGEMGKMMTQAGAVISGLALGGAGLGVAALGRGTIGKVMKKASTSEAAENYEKHKAGTLGRSLTFKERTFGAMGYGINNSQKHVEHAEHARHELDKESEAKYQGKKFKELSGTERKEILLKVSKDDVAMKKHGKAYKNLSIIQKGGVDTDVAALTKTKGQEYLEESKKKKGLRTTLLQSARTGSWDVRNLSTVTAAENDKTLNKFASGLTSILGNTMRSGIKNSFGAQYGQGQKAFFKDLGHTISEAMKGAQVHVDLSHVGAEKKDGDHGDGHGGGGHGGGHH